MNENMELLIFFLKIWSIIWSIISFLTIYFFFKQRPKNLNLLFNLKTCFEWSLWVTSLYSWTF